MDEWRILTLGPGVLARRFAAAVIGWIAAFAVAAAVCAKASKVPLLIFGAGAIALAVTVWLGLLVRLTRPGIFVADDKVKIRKTFRTYVLPRAHVRGFEQAPVSSAYFAARGKQAIWVAARDGRRIETSVQTRAERRDPYRRSRPGPKLTPQEIDATVNALNRWAGVPVP
jgi:hypothetical protein